MNQPAAARQSCSIVIHFDPALLSPNKRLHPMARWRIGETARVCAEGAWVAAGRPRFHGKTIRLDIIVRRARRMDADNCIGGIKAIRDAIFARRRIQTPGKQAYYEQGLAAIDDSDKYVRPGQIEQEIDPKWRHREEVVFIIQEV